MRIARELSDGDVVNLGIGIGSQVVNYTPPDYRIIFHSETGILGYGAALDTDQEDLMDSSVVDANGHYVRLVPGTCVCDAAEAFDVVRTGRVDVTVLGALQVSEKGDLANWSTDPAGKVGTMGGAMDVPAGARRVIVGMEHVSKSGQPKLVKECTLPLTIRRRVSRIITDVAVIDVSDEGLWLKEVAPGWTVEDVQAVTEPELRISPDLKVMEL
ncbi:MAG: 3-oxoacid CoA-transferase subunit B [Chloroflexi bacterium]|nr:3-oxoacid CoA-transferase subunit B [Chloroflexota bacterium]